MSFEGLSREYRLTDGYSIRFTVGPDLDGIICRWLPEPPGDRLSDRGCRAYIAAEEQFLTELELVTGEQWHTRPEATEGLQ